MTVDRIIPKKDKPKPVGESDAWRDYLLTVRAINQSRVGRRGPDGRQEIVNYWTPSPRLASSSRT